MKTEDLLIKEQAGNMYLFLSAFDCGCNVTSACVPALTSWDGL